MLNEKHIAILTALRSDARKSLTVISKETGIPTSTVYDYYRDLQPILRHATLPDFKKLGYPLRKLFLLSSKDRDATFAWLQAHPLVNNLSRINSYDAAVEAYFQEPAEVEDFKEALQRLAPRRLEEYDILEELKHEAFTPSLPDA